MAHHGRTKYDGETESRSIEVLADGDPPTGGTVTDESGHVLGHWSWSGSEDVWVGVGQHRSGSITEEGHDDTAWRVAGI